jgi:SpoVK/Ycf46/Vps4 family AAA+-type ATPase
MSPDKTKSSQDKLKTNRKISQNPIPAFMQQIIPKTKMDEILLAPNEKLTLKKAVQQSAILRKTRTNGPTVRGSSVKVLFLGTDATNKSQASEILANELELNLFRIDLSAAVSKYIGETEQNLNRVFDAAEEGGAVLFFDEADALFGKRTKISDDHDRYANVELSFLLQKIEEYRGLAILATNLKIDLDPAVVRRFDFVINFSLPKNPPQ